MATYRLAILAALGMALSTSASAGDAKWRPHIDLEGKAGSDRHLGEADLFLPVAQNADTLLFADLRTRLDDQHSREGNFGLGLRHMLELGWNLGGYGFFDRRRSEYHNYFNQITVGAEALSLDWDLRVNGYVPIGRRSYDEDSLNIAELSGSTVIFRGGEERSLGGFDAEIGWRVPLFAPDAGQQLRLYGGGYRFADEGVPDVAGPRGRAELVFDTLPGLWDGSRLALGAEIQRDDPRGTQGFLSARLRIPLQDEAPTKLTAMERRMTDPIVRDIDVVAQAGAYGAAEPATPIAADVTMINGATTNGAELESAIEAVGAAGKTFVLIGQFNTTSTIQLQTGQTLTGGGSLGVLGASGRTATLALPGATINAATLFPGAITTADNSTIRNLTVRNTGAWAVAIRADGAHGVSIIGNTISTHEPSPTQTVGIVAPGPVNNLLISGNAISATGGGLSFALAIFDAQATVTGNTLYASGGTPWNEIALLLSRSTIGLGSTGNVAVNGNFNCWGNSGSVYFVNAPPCGP